MNITREIFDEQRRPRFGMSNPEKMNLAFWEWMIRDIQKEPIEQDGVFLRLGFADRESRLKPRHSAHGARKTFQVKYDPVDGPVWTFDRFGTTETELPDGRIVYIAGEHEDSYDPDFYIYNDVIVLGLDGQIEIYGYPKAVFSPTDFHTATLVDDSIIIIGCIGYVDQRLPGHTPVYALNVRDYSITEIKTAGEMPGWIFEHEAELQNDGSIKIKGGKVDNNPDRTFPSYANLEEYSLDLKTGLWRKLTNQNSYQFCIRRKDREYFPYPSVILEDDVFTRLSEVSEVLGVNGENLKQGFFVFQKCFVEVNICSDDVEVTAARNISLDNIAIFVEIVRAEIETAIGFSCESLHLAGGT